MNEREKRQDQQDAAGLSMIASMINAKGDIGEINAIMKENDPLTKPVATTSQEKRR